MSTKTLKLRAYTNLTGVQFMMPKSLNGKRFKIVWSNDTVTLIADPKGNTVCRWAASGGTYYRIQFGLSYLPFKPKSGKPQNVSAIYDGHTLVMNTPIFEPKDGSPAKRDIAKSLQPKPISKANGSFSKLKSAIEDVNSLADEYGVSLEINNNVISGVISV